MIKVIDRKIKQYNLPKSGQLKDGSTVSGYHLLDKETLKEEGWLPLEDNPPSYDEETQYLTSDGYDIQKDKVIKKYRVENIPEPQPNVLEILKKETEILKAKVQSANEVAEFQEDLIVELAMKLY